MYVLCVCSSHNHVTKSISYFIVGFTFSVKWHSDDEVKLHPNTVDMLKHLNIQYPMKHEDYDEKFIRQLMKAIFRKPELKKCSKTNSLKSLNRPKLKFAKGVPYVDIDHCSIKLTVVRLNNFCLISVCQLCIIGIY